MVPAVTLERSEARHPPPAGEAPGPDAAPADLPELLAGAAAGDERAWRELVRLYGRRVFALVYARCRNPDLAEEITQSVFVTLAAKLGDAYTESGRFEAWVFRIALNRLRDELRRHKRRAGIFAGSDALDEHPDVPPTDDPLPDDLQALRTAIAGLGDADREIIELRHHAGLAFKDIAALRGEPIGTLLARHHRAVRKLRQSMERLQRSASEDPPTP